MPYNTGMTNAELAAKLRDLRDFLIIAGYEESHATRYTTIARTIEKMPESVEEMKREHRLTEIPQVGKLIALYIKEILDEGVSSKQKEWEKVAPISVLELVRIPGLGPKTASVLFHSYGIDSLASLREADAAGILDGVPGIGPKLRLAIQDFA
jgi:DNA polymerase (family 10)